MEEKKEKEEIKQETTRMIICQRNCPASGGLLVGQFLN